MYPVLAPFTLCISLREREESVAHLFTVFAQEMEIHVAILVSSAAEGFRRSGSSRQSFAASMSVFVKLKLVGDFFFWLFCDFVWCRVSSVWSSALQFEMSFLFGVLLFLDVFACLQASSQTFSSFSSSHERSAKCMEFRFCIRVFRRVVGTSSVLCSLNCPFFRVHLQFWICCFGCVCISSSILQNTFFFFTKMICQVARSWNFGFGLGFLDLLSVLLQCPGV